MRRIFFSMCLLLVALGTPMTMNAESKEKDKVIVTLNDGTTVEGYQKNGVGSALKRLFSSTGSILSFVKVSPTADGKNAKTYKAKEIKGYRFVNDSTEFESQDFCSPVPFKWNKKTRGLFRVEKRMKNGTIYWYQTYITRGGKNSVSYLVPTYGVKLRGDDRIYNIIINGKMDMTYLSLSLSKLGPEALANKFAEYFKEKGHRKELIDDPTLIIRLYDEYLNEGNPAISREKTE